MESHSEILPQFLPQTDTCLSDWWVHLMLNTKELSLSHFVSLCHLRCLPSHIMFWEENPLLLKPLPEKRTTVYTGRIWVVLIPAYADAYVSFSCVMSLKLVYCSSTFQPAKRNKGLKVAHDDHCQGEVCLSVMSVDLTHYVDELGSISNLKKHVI